MIKFFKYFLYLAWNWNLKIAWRIIKEETGGEKKYALQTTGADDLRSLEKIGIDISHATLYMPASYYMLELFFAKADVSSSKHLIDLGCGKGRALCVSAHFGVKKMTGVEFSKKLFIAAKENLSETQKIFPEINFQVYNNDAFYFDIAPDADFIFLFNPFDEVIMSGVLVNILTSLENYPRDMTIIYINPLQKEMFLKAGFSETFYFQKMKYLEGSILEKKKESRTRNKD